MPTQSQSVTSTTQLFLDIHDITNNLVIMKNGTTSVIISVDAMNFGLLAEEEQDGVIYAYAGLLNSLNYPIQIVVRSQTKDVTQYLTLLKEQEEMAPNRLMQNRIRTYREFVSNLIRERNVLDKKFYVVIPASAIELGLLAPQTVLPGSKPIDLHTVERTVILEKAKSILEPKRDHLIAQFARIGLLARELETQEIIQMFYISYNPEAAEGQEITDSSSYTTPLVKAGMQNIELNSAVAAPVSQPIATQPITSNQATSEPMVSEPVAPQAPLMPVAAGVLESPPLEAVTSLPIDPSVQMTTEQEQLLQQTTISPGALPVQPPTTFANETVVMQKTADSPLPPLPEIT